MAGPEDEVSEEEGPSPLQSTVTIEEVVEEAAAAAKEAAAKAVEEAGAPPREAARAALRPSSLHSDTFDSQTLQDLNVVRDHLNLRDTDIAVSISARLAAFLFREVQRGGSIHIEHKSGAKSKLVVSET